LPDAAGYPSFTGSLRDVSLAQKKAHEVDGWIARPDKAMGVVLVYGPDRGLVSERARRFAQGLGLPLDDPFSVVRLDASTIEQDPGRLADEARTVPMFADRRLIWLTDAGAQKGLADQVASLAADPARDAVVLIEAGDLKKTAPLRTIVEKAAGAMALPCYADEARALDGLIEQELSAAGLTISLEARQLLKASLGGDRLASRSELTKLVLYCKGHQRIELADVVAATGDVAAVSVDNAVDAAIAGDVGAFDSAYSQVVRAGHPPFLVLSGAIRQFQMLLALRADMETNGKAAGAAVANARPPVFFARKSLVQAALERHRTESLSRILKRLNQTVLEIRRRPDLATAVARHALMAIALESKRS